MQILSSGSFINLENQEKIEQLIFTAKEIANAAVETDGFVNEEENNKRLALEIWQGAEYMCRDHEEANIKNVFVNNFLERLRAIGGTSKMPSSLPRNSAGEFADDSPIENTAPRDEFLGFVSTAEEKGITETGSDANEIAEETKISKVFLPKVNAAASIEDENRDMEIVEPDEALLAAAAEIENAGQESEKAIEPSQVLENSTANAIQTENNVKSAVGALRLPEKEPYQFDKCTVTATIQLLPTDTEMRKAVLSVRTHDFAPQISIVELTAGAVSGGLLPELEKAFEKYKTDLPVKVMDKLKKEKSTAKKQPGKTTVETKANPVTKSQEPKTVETVVPKPENNQSRVTTVSAVAQPAEVKSSVSVSRKAAVGKPENSQQGNLFGF